MPSLASGVKKEIITGVRSALTSSGLSISLLTVSEPVGGGGQRSLLRSRPQGERLAYNDPGHWSPSTKRPISTKQTRDLGCSPGKRGDEHARRDDHHDTSSRVVGGIHSDTDRGENEQPHCLPYRPEEQWPSSAKFLDDVQAVKGECDVDGAEDELGLDRVFNACRLEDRGAIVD